MIIPVDLGLAFSGTPSGNIVPGWDKPQPYTPKPDDGYICPAWLGDAIVTFRQRDPLWVFGPTGSGKTAGVKFIASRLNWPVYEITAHSRLEFPELCGSYHVEDGNMVWHDGPLVSAMRGGGVFLLNEGSLLEPSTAAGLNSILDGSPLFVPEINEYVMPHSEFRFVVTDNSNGAGDETGLYQGILRQNIALTSRFTFVKADYLQPDEEVQIFTTKVPALPQEIAKKMIELANLVRDAFIGNTDRDSDTAQTLSITMSPRDLLRWGRYVLAYEFLKNEGQDVVAYAFDRAFAFRADRPTQQTLHELLQRVFGSAPRQKRRVRTGETGVVSA